MSNFGTPSQSGRRRSSITGRGLHRRSWQMDDYSTPSDAGLERLLSQTSYDLTPDQMIAAENRKEQFRKFQERHEHKDPEDVAWLMRYESLDYHQCVNDLLKEEHTAKTWEMRKKIGIHKWAMVWGIGICTGAAAFVLGVIIDWLAVLRWGVAYWIVENGNVGLSYLYFVALACIYVGISSYMTAFHAPPAAGSGIPEVKSILNGVNLKDVLSLKTLWVKFFGVALSFTGGLCIGKEGPLVQTGSAIAMQINRTSDKHRWDNYRREFIACGTAAGISAAFGAPSASILFVLEEVSSFWSTPMMWMVMVSSFFSALMLQITKAAYYNDEHNADNINATRLVIFGQIQFNGYELWELILFAIMGVIGGFLGGLFNYTNVLITKWRKKNTWGRPLRRWCEAVSCAFITATLLFCAPLMVGECKYNHGFTHHSAHLVQFTCDHDHHNTMATLSFQTVENGIFNLLHNEEDFGTGPLFVYFFFVFFWAVITYGVAVPSGLIDPSTMAGAAIGRLIGELIKNHIYEWIHPGTYALVGATAFLGGVTRITLALALLMLGVINNSDYLLPLMLVTLTSKLAGDRFGISLYDIHIELKNVPFVEVKPPKHMLYLTAEDVMVRPVISFRQVENLATIVRILKQHSHNGYPVLNEDRRMVGLILRSQLIVLIKNKAFVEFDEVFLTRPDFAPNTESLPMDISVIDEVVEEISMGNSANLGCYNVDLRRYMDQSRESMPRDMPLTSVYGKFRTAMLRHLVITSHTNKVEGMITRKELMTDFRSDLA